MARKNKKEFSTSDIRVTFVKQEFDSDQNPLFSKVKINFLYKGLNRNGSYISKRTAEKIGKRIAYIPIVGEFLKEKEDFGTHGGKLTITSDDIVYEETTVPYGVVGAAENLWWEEVEDKDGNVVEYLTTWGYLWTKRYPDAERVLQDNNWQSMELDPDTVEGRWVQKKHDEDFIFHIDDAYISAFCILGENVEPCFEDSQVKSFSLEETKTEKFMLDFKEMQVDFANFMLSQNTLGETEKDDIDNSENDLEGGTKSMLYKLNIDEPSVVFSNLNENEEVTKIIIKENENEVIYFDLSDSKFYSVKYSIEEEDMVFEDAVEIVYELPTDTSELEEKINNLEEKTENFDFELGEKDKTIEELQGKIEILESSVTEYESEEAKRILKAKEDIINEFREQVSEEEIKVIEEQIENFSAEDIKAKLALIVYEASKEEEEDEVDPAVNFTKKKDKKPINGNMPSWFKTVVENRKK